LTSRRRTVTADSTGELGEITFDDWYEVPVFDVEPDERLEHLATSKRAPVRLFGATLLRLGSDGSDGSEGSDGSAASPTAAGSWRERAGRLLDRWAAAEAASQERLEGMVLPKRWRG
jgi:hypothetical protein